MTGGEPVWFQWFMFVACGCLTLIAPMLVVLVAGTVRDEWRKWRNK